MSTETETETRGRTKAKATTRARGCGGSGEKVCSKPKSGSKNKIVEAPIEPIVEEVCEPGTQCSWGAYEAPVWSFAPMTFSFNRAPEPVPEPIFFEE